MKRIATKAIIMISAVLLCLVLFAGSASHGFKGSFQTIGTAIKKGFGKEENSEPMIGPSKPSYKMNVTVDSKKHQLSGKLTVRFTNNLNKNLNELYFNLWGNADVFVKKGGSMDVSDITVDGKRAEYKVEGTSLHIPSITIKKDKSASVSMNFSVKFPNKQDRFGWFKNTLSMGNWFPILAVYDKEGWNVNPYFDGGESFYSLTGDYDVTVTASKNQVIAATGTEAGKPKLKGNEAIHRFKAQNVRDFAMLMNPDYKVKEGMVKNVKVNVYYTKEQDQFADAMLQSGLKSIELFSDRFGAYPWPELDIGTMKGWFGGMEYPQLVMMSINSKSTAEILKSYTAHEIGHQWFYGIIGNNEYEEPWMDESFAAFSSALYDKGLHLLFTPSVGNEEYHLSSPASTFAAGGEKGKKAYYQMIYGYGSRTLNDLRLKVGDKAFYSAMKVYFKEKKFGVTTTKDFVTIMERETGKDLKKFFKDHRVFLSDQDK